MLCMLGLLLVLERTLVIIPLEQRRRHVAIYVAAAASVCCPCGGCPLPAAVLSCYFKLFNLLVTGVGEVVLGSGRSDMVTAALFYIGACACLRVLSNDQHKVCDMVESRQQRRVDGLLE